MGRVANDYSVCDPFLLDGHWNGSIVYRSRSTLKVRGLLVGGSVIMLKLATVF